MMTVIVIILVLLETLKVIFFWAYAQPIAHGSSLLVEFHSNK